MKTEYPILDVFLKQFKPMLFRRKESIIDPGDPDYVFYLNQGYVRLYTISKEGTELTLHIFSPSCIIPILWNKNPRLNEYYFESLTPVEVYRCERNKLQQLLREKPDTNLEIMRQLTLFSESTIKKLELKIIGDAYQQVVATLLNLAECFGKKDKESIVISYWFTHQDIASIAGLSRERVTIEINNLLNKKLISYNNHFITISKLQLLKSEIE